MSLGLSEPSSCARPIRVLQVLLSLSLLLTALVPSTTGKAKGVDDELYAELRCMCVKTTSGIHPSHIQKLEVIRPGPHCPRVEVIAKLKNGNGLCLDPEAPRIRKIVQKILEGDGSAS